MEIKNTSAGYIYSITEANVDGCGGSATEFVTFNQPLNEQAQKAFRCYLAEAKAKASDKCWDTCDIIEEALRLLKDSGVEGTVCEPPYYDSIEF